MLAPVGNSIVLQASDKGLPTFHDYHSILLNSGTSALTLSLLIAKLELGEQKSDVIIPAYACPDLVTACIAANVKPVLCDIGSNEPGFDLNMLETLISEKTLAILAVNFLGIRDRIEEIQVMTSNRDIWLVEDNAQWFPEELNKSPFRGDCVCLSFGRGKPVSLLGGGAILIKQRIMQKHEKLIAQLIKTPHSSLLEIPGYYLHIRIYNLCLKPVFYTLVKKLPGTGIGETRYHEPGEVEYMLNTNVKLLHKNIKKYLSLSRKVELYFKRNLTGASENIGNLPYECGKRSGRLLRYPILLGNRKERDHYLHLLNQQGLGASAMYLRPLWEIENIPLVVEIDRNITNARSFADRLLTLPVHDHTTVDNAKQTCALFGK